MLPHSPTGDLGPSSPSSTDPLILYAKSLHDYTLRQWAESRRLAEEKARVMAANKTDESDAASSQAKEAPAKKPIGGGGRSLSA